MLHLLSAAALALFTAPQDSGTIHLQPVASNGIAQAGNLWMRCPIALSASAPAGIKVPSSEPCRYGVVTIGEGAQKLSYPVALEAPVGKTVKDGFGREVPAVHLYVDLHRDGDFTESPRPKTTVNVLNDHPVDGHSYLWTLSVPVYQGDKLIQGSIVFEYWEPKYAYPAQFADTLDYVTDFGLAGSAKIGAKTYRVALRDAGPEANFTPYKGRTAFLWIDRDDDGKFEPEYEQFQVDKPFSIDGVSYRIKDLSTSGGSFRIVPSTVRVAEKPVPQTFIPKVGAVIPGFGGIDTDGHGLNFPADYKGKVVLLDFWATWCGPCMAEAPNVVAAASRFKSKGFDVLGVSLDYADKAPLVRETAAKAGLTWRHLYDGQAWSSPIVKNLRVTMIPCAFLVDGATGEILAMGESLRGKNLANTIAKALRPDSGGDRKGQRLLQKS